MDVEKYQNGSHVCVVAKVPDHIADQFPKDSDPDADDPHITILFIGDIPKEKVGALINTCQSVFGQCSSIPVSLDSEVSYFDPSDRSEGRRVAKLDVICPDLHPLHKQLWDELEEAGVEVAHSHPEYHPHTTLDYIEPYSEYEGPVPQGKWDIDVIEIWGFEGHIPIQFINTEHIANQVVDREITKNVIARLITISEAEERAYQYGFELAEHYADILKIPVEYESTLRSEASTFPQRIKIGPKFLTLSKNEQDHVMIHELAHFKKIDMEALKDPQFWDLIQNQEAFGPLYEDGTIDGINGQYTPGENAVEAYALLIDEPQWLKSNYPLAYDYIYTLAKKIGMPTKL